MYIKSLYQFLSFKQRILLASYDAEYRNTEFYKYPPSRREVIQYIKKCNLQAISLISKYFFYNNIDILFENYKLEEYILSLDITKYRCFVDMLSYDVCCYLISGRMKSSKKNTKYLMNKYNCEPVFNVPAVYMSFDDVKAISNIYHSFSGYFYTPKNIIQLALRCKANKTLQWIQIIRKVDKNMDDTCKYFKI